MKIVHGGVIRFETTVKLLLGARIIAKNGMAAIVLVHSSGLELPLLLALLFVLGP